MYRKRNQSNVKTRKIYLDNHFIPVPNLIAHRKDLTPAQKLTFGAIVSYVHHKDGRCFPTKKRLAENVGLALKTVESALSRLHDLNLISWENNIGSSNSYSIHISDSIITDNKSKNEQIEKESDSIKINDLVESDTAALDEVVQSYNIEPSSINFGPSENESDSFVEKSIAHVNDQLQDIPDDLGEIVIKFSECFIEYFPNTPIPLWGRPQIEKLKYFVKQCGDSSQFAKFIVEFVFEKWYEGLALKWHIMVDEAPTLGMIMSYSESIRDPLRKLYTGEFNEFEDAESLTTRIVDQLYAYPSFTDIEN